MRPRDELVRRLADGAGDGRVLIVGGGINGLGVLRDLALQGVGAVLVDRGDVCSGTSAAPSRLIHGGLRYLETGEFALVRESVIERNHLLRNASHLVKPLRVWVPATSLTGGALSALLRFLRLKKAPGPKGALVVKLGLAFFDAFGRGNRVMPNHRLVSRREALARLPLSPRTKAVAQYYDARVTSPERLALEVAADAESDADAMAVPYVAAVGRDGAAVRLRDEISGATFAVRPALVVNCAGPWVDRADAAIGIAARLVGGTRGAHLVLDRPDVADRLGDLMLYFETFDHRACLVYRLDGPRILLGTTDIRTDDPSDTTASEAEIDYLLRVLDDVLPGTSASRADIVFAYAGVRPLPRTEAGATGAISRDHAIRTFEPDADRPFPVITLVGGKWTTYRVSAGQLADAVLARLGRPRRADTLGVPVGGGRDAPADWDAFAAALAARHGADAAVAARLVARYGTAADAVLAAVAADAFRTVMAAPAYFVAEIDRIARAERVTRLEDVVLRRTLLAFEDSASPAAVAGIGAIVGAALGWDAARIAAEIDATLALLRDRHRARAARPPLRAAAE